MGRFFFSIHWSLYIQAMYPFFTPHYYLRRTTKVMFSLLLVCVFMCLSVCLLATLQENTWMYLHEIFSIGGMLHNEQWTILKMFRLTPCLQGCIFPFFFLLFSWNFQDNYRIWDKEHSGTFWRCCINSLNPGSSFYFLDVYLLATLRETDKRIFMKFFRYVGNNTTE